MSSHYKNTNTPANQEQIPADRRNYRARAEVSPLQQEELVQPRNNVYQSEEKTFPLKDELSLQQSELVHPEDKLLQREYGLAQQLKNLCDDSGKEIDPSKSAAIIHELGLIYRQRSPDKFSLIRSAGLLNAAIVRKPSDVSQIEQDLTDLCKHILQQAEAANQTADLIAKAKEIKSSFTELRDEVDQCLSKSVESEPLTDIAQNEIPTKLEIDKISTIQSIQTKIKDTYTKTMANLSEYCEKVMGKPPCKYAVMGMGSLAREEATPYSDFEHMITLEKQNYKPQHLEYFRWFTLVFHIVILNVRETIIPALHIASLNDKASLLGDWFFDCHTCGISLDGMMPKASKYPLGRGPTKKKPWGAELIKPLNEMLKYLSSESELKEGYHLSDLLTKTCFVYGSREIYHQFVESAKNQSHQKTQQDICAQITKQVKEDLNKFSTRLCLAKLRNNDTINIKRLVYRSSTVFIGAMGRFHKIALNSCFDVVSKMAELSIITPQTKHSLMFAVAIACEMRLRVYMEHKSQSDLIEIKVDTGGIKNFLKIVGQASTIRYFQIVYCLQCEVAKLLRLTKRHFYANPQMINVAACYAFGIHGKHGNETSRTTWNIADFSFDDCLNELVEQLKNMQSCVEDDKSENDVETFKILASHLFDSYEYDEAMEFYKRVLDFYQKQQTSEVESNKSPIGTSSHSASPKYFPARKRQSFSQVRKDAQCATTNDEHVARTLNYIGESLINLSKPDDALKNLEKSLQLFRKLSLNEETDSRVARTMNNIGLCHRDLHQYKKGLEYFLKSLNVYQKISLNEEADPNVAMALSNIGTCLVDLQHYTEGLDYLQKSLTIKQSIPLNEEADSDVVSTLNNVVRCLHHLNRYTEELECLQKLLKIYQKRSLNEKTDTDVASTLNNIGNCFRNLHQYPSAIENHQKSLAIRQNISTNADDDSNVALTLHTIGLCFHAEGQYTEALQHFQKSLKIYQNAGDDSGVNTTLKSINLCETNLQ